MKKIELKMIVFAVFLCFCLGVKAEDKCEKDELTRLRTLANKVELDYSYEMKEDTLADGTTIKLPIFSITANNLNPELRVVIMQDYYNDKYEEFVNNGDNKGVLKPFIQGDKVTVTVLANVKNYCSGKKLTTKTIKLPYYNDFYESDKCILYRDFDKCVENANLYFCNRLQEWKYYKEFLDEVLTSEKFNAERTKFLNKYDVTYHFIQDNESSIFSNYVVIGIIAGIIIFAIAISFFLIKGKKKKNKIKIVK